MSENETFKIKVDVALTREQVRNYLGSVIVDKDDTPDKVTLTVIRELIRASVQGHIVAAKMDWEFLATDDQIEQVDAALKRILPEAVAEAS